MSYSNAFLKAINFILSQRVEGVLSMDPDDKGNWTGGEVGSGELRGTKFGISAAAYPDVDVSTLTKDQAIVLYHRDYWEKIRGDMLPPRVAFVVFDSAVNQGVETASKLLQAAIGGELVVDGIIGPHTLAAARSVEQTELVLDILSHRAVRYTRTKQWEKFGRGWMKRLLRQAMES